MLRSKRKPLRASSSKRKSMGNVRAARAQMWDSLPWHGVDVSQVDMGDFEDSVFMGLEELDGNAYVIQKEESAIRAEPAITNTSGTSADSSTAADEEVVAAGADVKGKKRKTRDGDDTKQGQSAKVSKSKSTSKPRAANNEATAVVREAEEKLHRAIAETSPWGASSQCAVQLSSILTTALQALQFEEPTPIQSAAVPLSTDGGCDIIGAAETGSGKTLAFVLPVLQSLLRNWSTCRNIHAPHALIIAPTRELALQISSVLREISKSIAKQAQQASGGAVKLAIEVVSIIGGMSEQKQRRQLSDKGKPLHIVVATPGRLCEILEDNSVTAFQDMSVLRFLIVDEADRIMEEGHYSELNRVFSRIADHEAIAQSGELPTEVERKRALGVNEVDESTSGYVKPPVNKDMPDYDHDAVMQELKELEPVEVPEMPSAAVLEAARAAAGEEIYQPLDDVDDHSDVSAADANVDADVDGVGETGNGGEEMDDAAEGEQDDTGSRSDDDDAQNLRAQRIRWVGQRQTFLYSATAIVKNMKSLKDRKNSGKKKRMKLKGTLTGMKDQSALPEHLRELMALVGVQKKIHVVDVTAAAGATAGKDNAKAPATDGTTDESEDSSRILKLPNKLKQLELHVPTDEKDVYAYYYIIKNPERTLVFTNSIKTARRVDGLLRALGVNSRCLHAQMQQRQRLRALEAFASVPIGVLVATDVAARGLDVSNIQSVLHYDIARSPQVYVHRSGRTARANKAGTSISLVSPEDAHHHRAICELIFGTRNKKDNAVDSKSINGKAAMPVLHVDLFSLPLLRQRVQAAKKIFVHSLSVAQGNSEQRWLQKSAEEADLVVDENVLSEFSAKHEDAAGRGDTNRNGSGGATAAGTKKELARAKAKLRALLDTPVPDANNGLSGYGVNALTATSAHVKAMGMRPTKTKLKREANVEQSWKKRSSFFVYNPSL